MNEYFLKIPSQVYAGIGSLKNVANILAKECIKNLTILTDRGVRNNNFFRNIVSEIENKGVTINILDELASEPSYCDVEKVVHRLEEIETEFIVAIGGGSVMDIGKLCSILKGADYNVKDLLKNPHLGRKKIKTLLIPTTCGTGSEATCNSIVSVPEEGIKVGIVNDDLIPDYVILDPKTIENLPKKLIAATGVDALAHCIECLTSKKANRFSELYALAGGVLIIKNIRETYLNPQNLKAKEKMLLGAFYGGIAITSSGTTAIHALSYPLGGRFHIPHGISNAIMMLPVLEFNKDVYLKQFSKLSDELNHQLTDGSEEEKVEYILSEIKDILKVTEIPMDLEEFGVAKKDLDFLVEAGSKVTRLLANNLKELSLDDIKNIYLKVLK